VYTYLLCGRRNRPHYGLVRPSVSPSLCLSICLSLHVRSQPHEYMSAQGMAKSLLAFIVPSLDFLRSTLRNTYAKMSLMHACCVVRMRCNDNNHWCDSAKIRDARSSKLPKKTTRRTYRKLNRSRYNIHVAQTVTYLSSDLILMTVFSPVSVESKLLNLDLHSITLSLTFLATLCFKRMYTCCLFCIVYICMWCNQAVSRCWNNKHT